MTSFIGIILCFLEKSQLLTQDQCFSDAQFPMTFVDENKDFRLHTIEFNQEYINIVYGGIYSNYPCIGNYWNNDAFNRLKWFKYYSITGVDHSVNAYRVHSLVLKDQVQIIFSLIINDISPASDDTLILAVSNEATGDFLFSKRFSGIIRPGIDLKRLQSIGQGGGLWYGLHDSSSRAWLIRFVPDESVQTFYDTGLNFKFTGACVDNTLDRIIYAGFIQGVTNKIALYDGNTDPAQSQTDVHSTPNNHQIQIEHMVKNGQNLYGCVSSYYLTSSNLRHYGIFVRESFGSTLGFYYSTESVGNRILTCLGIHYDSGSDTLTTYVKALNSGVPYINKLVIVNPLHTGLTGALEASNKAYSFLPDTGYNFAQIDVVQRNGFKIVGTGTVVQSGQRNIGFVSSNWAGDFWRDSLGSGSEYSFTAFSTYQSNSVQSITPTSQNTYPSGITGQDNALKIAGDLLQFQKTNTTYSNVVGGKLSFEITPISQAFVCILNYQCPLIIAKATLKGCLDSGKTFTFQQSLEQFNNSTSLFENPTIPVVYSPTTNQNNGVQMTVKETRASFLFNTYTFRVSLSFSINNTVYETDQSLLYKIYFDHVCMIYAREATKGNVNNNLFYIIGQDKLVVDFSTYMLYNSTYSCLVTISKIIIISTLPEIATYNVQGKQLSLYSVDSKDAGFYSIELSITFQVNNFSQQLIRPFYLGCTATANAFNVPLNTAPHFTPPLDDQTIDVKNGESIIKLPDSKDDDGNAFNAKFQFGAASVFVLSYNINSIKLNPLKTHVGVYQIRVILTDLYPQPKSSINTFSLNVIDTTVYELPKIEVNEDLNEIYKLQITDVTNEGVVTLKHDSQFKFVSNTQLIRSQKLLDLMIFPYEAEYLDKKPIIKDWNVIKVSDKQMQIQLEFNYPAYVSQSEVKINFNCTFNYRNLTTYQQM
eukprot:403354483